MLLANNVESVCMGLYIKLMASLRSETSLLPTFRCKFCETLSTRSKMVLRRSRVLSVEAIAAELAVALVSANIYIYR